MARLRAGPEKFSKREEATEHKTADEKQAGAMTRKSALPWQRRFRQLREPLQVFSPVERQIAVIDLQAQGPQGGAVDTTAVRAPLLVGVPASRIAAVESLAAQQCLLHRRI